MNKFGIREVCNCTFKPLGGQPAHVVPFVIDTAKMTTLEGATTTVYAQGGQGHGRLMAWEGERTLTFTVEDALLTPESFQALTGASKNTHGNKTTYSVYNHQFAGYYRVEAQTLVRDMDGVDHAASIVIPRAKLQTTLNLPMGSSGDPSAFTFTFDVFPGDDHKLFDMLIDELAKDAEIETVETTINVINGNEIGDNYDATAIQVVSINNAPTISFNTTEQETSLVILKGATSAETVSFGDSQWKVKLTPKSRLICPDGRTVESETLIPGGEYLFVIQDIK